MAKSTMQEKHNLPLPEFDYTDPYLSLVFPRSIEAVRQVSGNRAVEVLSGDELNGYEWIKSRGDVSRREYAEKFKIDDKKAARHLKKLKDLGIISDNGESPKSNNYRYTLIPA